MANPQILTIKIPHLLRDTGNMNLQKIELPRAYEVDLKVQITTTNGKEPTTAVKARLEAAALEVFVYYEKIIKEEAKKLDKKIVKLLNCWMVLLLKLIRTKQKS